MLMSMTSFDIGMNLFSSMSESLEKVQRGEIQVVKRVKLKGKFPI